MWFYLFDLTMENKSSANFNKPIKHFCDIVFNEYKLDSDACSRISKFLAILLSKILDKNSSKNKKLELLEFKNSLKTILPESILYHANSEGTKYVFEYESGVFHFAPKIKKISKDKIKSEAAKKSEAVKTKKSSELRTIDKKSTEEKDSEEEKGKSDSVSKSIHQVKKPKRQKSKQIEKSTKKKRARTKVVTRKKSTISAKRFKKAKSSSKKKKKTVPKKTSVKIKKSASAEVPENIEKPVSKEMPKEQPKEKSTIGKKSIKKRKPAFGKPKATKIKTKKPLRKVKKELSKKKKEKQIDSETVDKSSSPKKSIKSKNGTKKTKPPAKKVSLTKKKSKSISSAKVRKPPKKIRSGKKLLQKRQKKKKLTSKKSRTTTPKLKKVPLSKKSIAKNAYSAGICTVAKYVNRKATLDKTAINFLGTFLDNFCHQIASECKPSSKSAPDSKLENLKSIEKAIATVCPGQLHELAQAEGSKYIFMFEQGLIHFDPPRRSIPDKIPSKLKESKSKIAESKESQPKESQSEANGKSTSKKEEAAYIEGVKKLTSFIFTSIKLDKTARNSLSQLLANLSRTIFRQAKETSKSKTKIDLLEMSESLKNVLPDEIRHHAHCEGTKAIMKFESGFYNFEPI